MSLNSAGGRRRGRRARRAALAEINVTPLVDVMLVLLIVFMVSAPLMTAGVQVELPKTEAGPVNTPTEPLTLTIRKDGALFVQQTPTTLAELTTRLRALSHDGFDKPIYVRADGAAAYASVAAVMARLSSSGFTKIDLITDTGAPESLHAAPNAAPAPTSLPSGTAQPAPGLRPEVN